jgi:hypothetical protein
MKLLADKKKYQFFNRKKASKLFDPDMMVQIYELLQGDREMIKIYSKSLGSEICFVNAETTPAMRELPPGCPVYTTEELAFVLTLSEEEFKRFHYLKNRLTD